MRNTERNKLIKQYGAQFKAAINLLYAHYKNDTEIRELINTGLKMNITPSQFSKLHGASRKSDYYSNVSEKLYKQIFEFINPIIEEKESKVWSELDRKYMLPEDLHNHRLLGLVGTWKAYTWDFEHSNVYAFKIKIIGIDKIICKTEETTFNNGCMRSLGTEKVSLEISHLERKVYVIVNIGTYQLEDLQRKPSFKLAYIDSGTTKIKAGFAFIERTNEEYESIIPGGKPLSEFEIKGEDFIIFIRGAQYVI
jgi:hypothetical protein